MKAIIFGIDGATFNILYPMIKNGLVTHISSSYNSGVHGKLHSIFPPITFPAWTSFKTGKNPAKHGVFDFLKDVPYMDDKPSKVSIADKKERSFFSLLSEHGYKIGVQNVPATYPPEKVNGVFISGFSTPSINHPFTHPTELKQELIKKFDYEFDIIEKRIVGKEEEFLQLLTETTKKITKTACHLLQNDSYDFFMVNYMAVDQIQHFFYGYRDKNHPLYAPEKEKYGKKIEQIYQLIDEQIGIIKNQLSEPVNMFFVSDHGFGPLERVVYLNEWLRKEGFLSIKEQQQPQDKLHLVFTSFLNAIIERFPDSLIRFVPQSMKNKANTIVSWTQVIDWKHTKAYSGGYPGKIYININGREKEGIIQRGKEYEDLINQIIKKAWQMKDPDSGELIVSAVYKNNEIYNGKYFDIAPDLIIIMKDMAYLNKPGFNNGKMIVPPPQGGDHRLHGIFIASGPEITHKKEELENISICDVAPTILHLFNVPLQSEFDGEVLTQIFNESSPFSKNTAEMQSKDTEKMILDDTIQLLKIKKKL